MADPVSGAARIIKGTRLYGKAAKATSEAVQTTATAEQWAAYLKKNAKASELQDSGVLDWLTAMDPQAKLNRDEVLSAIRPPEMKVRHMNKYGQYFGPRDVGPDDIYNESVVAVRTGDLKLGMEEYNVPLQLVRRVPGSDLYASMGAYGLQYRRRGLPSENMIDAVRDGTAIIYKAPVNESAMSGANQLEQEIFDADQIQRMVRHTEFMDRDIDWNLARQAQNIGDPNGFIPLFWSVNTYNPKNKTYTVLEWQRDLRRQHFDPDKLVDDFNKFIDTEPKSRIEKYEQVADLEALIDDTQDMNNVFMRIDAIYSRLDVQHYKSADGVVRANIPDRIFDDIFYERYGDLHGRVPEGYYDTIRDKIPPMQLAIYDDLREILRRDADNLDRIGKMSVSEWRKSSREVRNSPDDYMKLRKNIIAIEEKAYARKMDLQHNLSKDAELARTEEEYRLTGSLSTQQGKREIENIPFDRNWNLAAFKIDLENALMNGAREFRWSKGETVWERWHGSEPAQLERRQKQYDIHIKRDIEKFFKKEVGIDVEIKDAGRWWSFKITPEVKNKLYELGKWPAYGVAGAAVTSKGDEDGN